MPVTIQDVANAAGVSPSTISRALADSPRVKLETRRRVQQLAQEMGYMPSAIARGLATRRTHKLGVVVLALADPFVSELVSYIDQVACQHGYSLLLSSCGDDPQRELAAFNLLRQQRVDAVIVADPSVPERFVPSMKNGESPVVLINKKHYPHSVATDNLAAATLAVNHLLDLGHTRLAYIGSSKNKVESQERLTGYQQTLTQRGMPVDPSLIVEGDGGCQGGWQGAAKLLRLPEPPTAIFCFDDLTAMGAMGAIQATGLSVPGDISVVGCDDIALGQYLSPPLTTVAQYKDQLARLSVEMALSLLHAEQPMPNQLLPARLVLRGSTGCK
jgi:DNA-binding LacI/PurR family transcriptional regulator